MTDLRSARVLLVGTGRHAHGSGLPGVPAVPATLRALRRALVERCGVAPGNIRVLIDPADPMTFGDAVATVTEQATGVLLVYFVGHGLVGTDATLHLAARSSDFRPNRIPHTALPFRTVREYLRDSPARSKIVILDCCWGGLAIETLGADGSQFAEMSRIDGTFVVTAAGSYEKALASDDDRFTRFSGALLSWMTTGDPSGGAELTLDAMYRSLRGTLLSGGGPEPQRRATGGTGDLVVMHNPAYVAPPPPAEPAASQGPLAKRSRWTPRRRVVTGLIALTTLALVGWYGINGALNTCTGSVQITLGVAPEIAANVDFWAESWIEGLEQSASEPCVSLTVTPTAPATVAAAVAARAERTVTGLAPPEANPPVPDVWIPDSSLWLERVRAADRGLVPAAAPSIADSPIVLAVAKGFAPSAGWSRTPPSWSDIRAAITTDQATRPGIVDPVTDASGLAMLQALEPEPGKSATAERRGTIAALNTGRTELRDELLSRMGHHPALDRPVVNVAALPEYAVSDYNAANPSRRLAVVRPTPALSLSLDYPYTILPAATGAKATMAARFGASLAGEGFAELIGRGGGLHPPLRTEAAEPPAIDLLLGHWLAAVRPLRVALIVDVSASSATKMPETGGMSRLEVASGALEDLIAVLDDTCSAGIWRSSKGEPRMLVATGPMFSRRSAVRTALAGLTPDAGSRENLAEAILAGYRDARDGWQPGRRNLVVVMATGDNADLRDVGAQLRRQADPDRPVDVAVVALGPKIPSTADVRVYPAATGAGAGEALLQALSAA